MRKRDWLILVALLLMLVVWVENRDSAFSSAEFVCSIAVLTGDELASAIKDDQCKPDLSRMLSAAGPIAWHGDRQE